jgi:7-cyano-7-deazaguanine synthase
MGENAIAIMSGGIDSTVAAAYAKNQGYNLSALHINYGQLTEAKELSAFNKLSDFFGISNRLVITIEYLKKIGGSALLDTSIPINEAGVSDNGIPLTYVPFRNAHFIATAVSWAEVLHASKIFIGAVEEDSSGYPDCREVYFEAFNKLLSVGLSVKHKIEIVTPLIRMSKIEIVKLGAALNVPFEYTWSCYQYETEACGVCDSCRLRLKGFKGAAVKDPINYKFDIGDL